ncbi:transposase, Ptta/En/Spm [Tanacetum coccineum]|uniref:Transposase, Ptta/En/Spm n=1 Tax=Tanacetum coccineum TaxID=301880 RepID=A0ABQ5CTN0_9ASTR
MARRKRLCMISTEAENEQQHNKAQSQSNGHSANETNDANSSQMDTTTNEHSDNQNELGGMCLFNTLILIILCPPKKVRGHTQKNELWNMNKNKIVVKFNKYGKPVGVAGNELTQFLGSVVRIAGNVKLHCEDWRKADKEKKKNLLSIRLKQMKPEYQAICEQKRISRSKMEEPHITGTKSFARLAEEEATKNNGVHPTRGKLYQISRTRKDGSIVNDKAAQVVASLQVIANDSTNTQGIQEDDWTNDDLSKVKGPEKRGYVRCVGKMLSLRNNGASSSTSSQTVEHRLAQTEDILYTLVNLLKDPTANSNLPDILRSMNIQIPDNFSPGQNNSTNGNLGNSDQRSSVADQNIDSWGCQEVKSYHNACLVPLLADSWGVMKSQ